MTLPISLPTSMRQDEGEPFVLAWYGCDLATGGIAEDLRSLSPSGALSRRLGDETSASFSLDLGGAPTGWEAATDQGRTMLVGVDTLTDTPLWAGIITGPREGGSGANVLLNASTVESYLNRRFTGNISAVNIDYGQILENVMTPALTGGPPLEIDMTSVGALGNYTVLDADDRSILSCAQELMGLDGGPEWTVDVVWADAAHTKFKFIIHIRSKIGVQVADPEAVLDHPGCVAQYRLIEDYSAERGATRVIAYGDASESARLRSATHQADALLAAGWPLWEHRFTPAAGSTDLDGLNSQAAAALRLMQTGARVWQVEAIASQAPRLGTAWGLGDNVRIEVAHSPRHPNGASVVARAWAWELDPSADRARPILVEGD